MRNIVRDIEQNCPECECSVEETIKYLYVRGDIVQTSEYYREVWFFYQEALDIFDPPFKKKKARELTLEHFGIHYETFRNIRRRVKGKEG